MSDVGAIANVVVVVPVQFVEESLFVFLIERPSSTTIEFGAVAQTKTVLLPSTTPESGAW